jgi:hypothetical protein
MGMRMGMGKIKNTETVDCFAALAMTENEFAMTRGWYLLDILAIATFDMVQLRLYGQNHQEP